jgi:endo-1,4-beta-xylanase
MTMKKTLFFPVLFVAAILMFLSCSSQPPGLKDVFGKYFLIGTSMNAYQLTGKDPLAKPFIIKNFNSITAENAMKWERIHPKPGVYDFAIADSIVAFAMRNNMTVIGHTLVWHSQTPDWVFQDSAGNPLSREALLERMKDHIFTVVGHYKGRVKGWDVVNEAVGEDGSWRKSKWYNIIGEDYIQKAFEFAHEADPDAELYYNDYNNELRTKRDGVVKIIKSLQQNDLRIDGVGIQGHWHLDAPDLNELDESLSVYASLGLKNMITEMEVNVLPTPPEVYGADVQQQAKYLESLNPYKTGCPDSVQTQLANRYSDIFKVFLKHKNDLSRITFWGINDGYSWKNDWPIKGRTNYPLLFDRKYQPKPAFYSVVKTVKE